METSSGTVVSQTSAAAGQRGANAQPGGNATGDGGEPSIDASRLDSRPSILGIDRNKPIVYGIAGDAYEMCEGDNEIAVELVIDASRLEMAGYPDAGKEISALCKAHGFGVVRAALSKTIQLL